MTFKQWITSSYPNPAVKGQWGVLHIITLLLCVAVIITLALVFRHKSLRAKKTVLWTLAGCILFFELARRIINFSMGGGSNSLNSVLYTLLPRPWCAISCWCIIFTPVVNKKWFYNLSAITALLCALIFFAYPGVGFNNQYLLFENVYSIMTHSLILISSITLITLQFTDFKYRDCWPTVIGLVVIYIYAFVEIYWLKIASDPLYFMPGNDVQDVLGLGYGAFLTIYIVFIIVYFNLFYLIADRHSVAKLLCGKQQEQK